MVEKLLATAAAQGSRHVLDAPCPVNVKSWFPCWATGSDKSMQRIGPYLLIRKIGAGRFGEVYLAIRDDGSYRQRVAVKLAQASTITDESPRRFKSEKQFLAALDHPNVVKFLDADRTEDQHAYLVMEWVEVGVPITTFCDDHRLNTEDRLRLFLKVCEGIEHAHEKNVLHRDIKPLNILITPAGQPKIVDFGIAKLLNPDLGFEANSAALESLAIGTPEYWSPEQEQGLLEATYRASDVYSLGAVLYELLTGNRVRNLKKLNPETQTYEWTGSQTLPSKIVLEADANLRAELAQKRQSTPWGLARRLRGEIDVILATALASKQADRYKSAKALADDIQRYLDIKPIQACPATRRYRASKFVKRNKVSLVLTAVFLLASIGGPASGWWHAWQQEQIASEQGNEARRQARIAREQRDRAAQAFFHLAYLGANRASRVEALAVYEQSLNLFTQLAEEDPEALIHKEHMANCYNNMAVLYLNLGRMPEAEAAHKDALNIRQALFDADPQVPRRKNDVAASHNGLALLYFTNNQIDAALERYDRAITLRHELVKDHPENDTYQHDLASSLLNLGVAYRSYSDPKRAELHLSKARDLFLDLVDRVPNVAAYRSDLGKCSNNLALAHINLGNMEAATSDFKEALANYQSVVNGKDADSDDRHDLAATQVNLATFYAKNGNRTEAYENFKKAIITLEVLVAENRAVLYWQQTLALACEGQGVLLAYSEKAEERQKAVDVVANAVKTRRLLETKHPELESFKMDLIDALNAFASVNDRPPQLDKAIASSSEAVSLAELLLKKCHDRPPTRLLVQVARSYHILGNLFALKRNEPIKAWKAYVKAKPVWDRLAIDHPNMVEYKVNIGVWNADVGFLKLAEANDKWFSEAIRTLEPLHLQKQLDERGSVVLGLAFYGRAQCSNQDAKALLDLQQAHSAHRQREARFGALGTCGSSRQKRRPHSGGSRGPPTLARAKTGDNGVIMYNVACAYGLCVDAASADKLLSPKVRNELRERYAAKAIEALHRAANTGYFNDAEHRKDLDYDKDLKALRPRDDFRNFVKQLGR